MARTSRRVHEDLRALLASQQAQTLTHIFSQEHPGERQTIVNMAEIAGWRWLWQGRSRSEPLVLLRLRHNRSGRHP